VIASIRLDHSLRQVVAVVAHQPDAPAREIVFGRSAFEDLQKRPSTPACPSVARVGLV